MSGVFHPNGLPYFPVPKSLFTLGRCPDIKGSPLTLYVYLCYRSQEKSNVSVTLRNEELVSALGLTKDTVLHARAILEDSGFIKFDRGSTGYSYTLTNPQTGRVLLNSRKGDFEPLDFDDLNEDQLKKYYLFHLKGPIEQTATGIRACCPFHDDHSPSLEIDLSSGSKWYCHSCTSGGRLIEFEKNVAIAAGRNVTPAKARQAIRKVLIATGAIEGSMTLPEAVYPYHDADGVVIYEVVRYPAKRFRRRRPDPSRSNHFIWNMAGIQPVLYGLPAILKAELVLICEGEKDCDNLRTLFSSDDSVAITTCPGGASKWKPSYSKSLKGKRVVIFPDQDLPGRRHAYAIQCALQGIASEICIRNFPEGFKDMTDYLGEHGYGDIVDLIGEGWINMPVPI